MNYILGGPAFTFQRLGAILVALGAAGIARTAEPVPSNYVDLYGGLEHILDAELARSGSAEAGALPLGCTDLLMANCNRGPVLLRPETLAAAGLMLDRFRDLGISCVKIDIHYPLLRPDFPDADRYLNFYRSVVQQTHTRGLKVLLHVTTLFADTPFSPFHDIYRGLDLARFQREYRDMVRLILSELKPDYLALLTEPDTHARLTGLPELTDPKVFAGVIAFTLDGTAHDGTLVGAGSGSWSGAAYAREIAARTPVDFVCIHVYPITGNMIANAREMARIARAAGKQAFMDESWLFKTLHPGGGDNHVAASAEVFRLDPYSFWAPLDQKFIALMLKLAREERIGLVSFYWSSEFFSYIDYSSAVDGLPYEQSRQRHNRLAYQASIKGELSPTGEYLRTVLHGRGAAGSAN